MTRGEEIWDRDWIIGENLTVQQKEVLYLYLEACGINIYYGTRSYKDDDDYPLVGWLADHRVICNFIQMNRDQILSYAEVMAILTKKIKQQEET